MILDQVDLQVFKNTHTEIRGQVFDVNGEPFPIPAATFILTIKLRPFDNDDEAYIVKSSSDGDFLILDSDEGKWRVDITPDDLEDVPANEYQYDVQMTTADSRKYVIQRGRFMVYSAVTAS